MIYRAEELVGAPHFIGSFSMPNKIVFPLSPRTVQKLLEKYRQHMLFKHNILMGELQLNTNVLEKELRHKRLTPSCMHILCEPEKSHRPHSQLIGQKINAESDKLYALENILCPVYNGNLELEQSTYHA